MVMGYTSGRLGRMPAGYQMPQSGTSSAVPVGVTGSLGLSGSAGSSGAGGLAGVMLVAAAGLALFYVATRGIQGTRG